MTSTFYLKKILLLGLVWCATASHASVLSPENARRAIQDYRKTVLAADTIEALDKHWSSEFKKKQTKTSAEQLASMPPEARSAYKKAALDLNKEMARTMPEKADVTCYARHCKFIAKTTSGSTQTFLLKEEVSS